MRRSSIVLLLCTWACVALLLTPAPATAQDPDDGPTPRAATEGDLAEAESLLSQALFLERDSDRSGWLMAASFHIRSAQHRPLGDEQVFRSLFRAAQLLHSLGRDEGAQRTLEQSAAHARIYGHIEKEAEALLAAAWMAAHRGDQEAQDRWLSRAFLLTYSPLLPEETRQEVLRRILLPGSATAVTVVTTN